MAYQDDRAKHVSVEAPAEPFSLEALIAWLRTKPADEPYCYTSASDGCLFARFTLENGGAYNPGTGAYELRGAEMDTHLPLGSWQDTLAINHPRTFGAALARALALKGE